MVALPIDDEQVSLVIAPFNCLMHLYTWDKLLACFREVVRERDDPHQDYGSRPRPNTNKS